MRKMIKGSAVCDLALIAAMALLALGIYGFRLIRQQEGGDISKATVAVDFAQKPYNQKSMTGFLHSYKSNMLPKIAEDLKPRYWRIGGDWIKDPKVRARVVNELNVRGIKPIFILSSAYKYKRMNIKGWVDPATSADPFLDIVAKQYLELGNKVIYDIWNEPNHKSYWQRSEEEFFQLFKKAHDKIRSLPGGKGAVISGPSTTGSRQYGNEGFLLRFLNFCNENDVRVDIVNWHDMDPILNYGGADRLKNNISAIRKAIESLPKVQVKEIVLTEMIGERQQYSPLAAILFNKALEEVGIDGACKACWNNSVGKNNCFNGSVDGIFTGEGKRRSVWWAYYVYGRSLTNRYRHAVSSKELVSIVSTINNGSGIQIVLANASRNKAVQTIISLNNLAKVLRSANDQRFKVTLYKVPESGEAVLNDPIVIYSEYLNTRQLSSYVVKKNIERDGLYFIEIA